MDKEIYYQRQWAETVRLYSGLLDKPERHKFIKKLGKKDILLASECRATMFSEEDILDSYLVEIALQEAVYFDKTERSAKGLLALAELNRFEDISNIFSRIPEGSNQNIHNDVVMQYISNGNELQIVTFLKVLSQFNLQLFNKALDRALDLGLVFSLSAQKEAEDIVKNLRKEKFELYAIKLICVFQLRSSFTNVNDSFELLINNRLLKYAERFIVFSKPFPTSKIDSFITNYVLKSESKVVITALIELFGKLKEKPDIEIIRKAIGSHLNPLVKKLIFSLDMSEPVTQELAYKICLNNINIGTKSAVEFAMELRTEFKLDDRITIVQLISALLNDPRPQRVEMACVLITEHRAFDHFPLSYIINLLIGNLTYENLHVATKMVQEYYSGAELLEKLEHLCYLGTLNEKMFRLTKEIALSELFNPNLIGESNRIHIGLVINIFKGYYSVIYGANHEMISFKRAPNVYLRLNSFIKFQHNNHYNDDTEKIKIIEIDIFKKLKLKFCYKNFFIGQVFDLKVSAVFAKRAFLKSPNDRTSFILPIEQSVHHNLENLKEVLEIGQIVHVRIHKFDFDKKQVICSIKDLIPNIYKESLRTPEKKFEKKLLELREKFNSR